jgi:hypothetical protein
MILRRSGEIILLISWILSPLAVTCFAHNYLFIEMNVTIFNRLLRTTFLTIPSFFPEVESGIQFSTILLHVQHFDSVRYFGYSHSP